MKTSRFTMSTLVTFMLVVLISSCGVPATPPQTPISSTTAKQQTTLTVESSNASQPTSSTPIDPVTPTPIPASWKTFNDASLKVQFRYPGEWQAFSQLGLKGVDGFVDVSLLDFSASLFDVMRTVCVLEANSGRPTAYGAGPLISDWQGWDAERQTWAGRGCTVTPSEGMPPENPAQSILYARYTSPQMLNKLLVLRTDAAHFSSILSTLRFQEFAPSPPSSGYYDSPAYDASKIGTPQVTLRTDRLVVTEIAIPPKDCDP